MQLINSTVIWKLSTIIFFPGAYIRAYIRGVISGGQKPRAYIRGLITEGIYPGDLCLGTYIRELFLKKLKNHLKITFEPFPKFSENFRRFPNTSEDFRRFSENFQKS